MSDFELDHRLAADSVFLADGPLSQLRLMDDRRFPWLVLVPRLSQACELIDLDDAALRQLMDEIRQAGSLLRRSVACDKLNIGALGNIVQQLHVHVVARTHADSAWPGPVWGAGSMHRYSAQSREPQLRSLHSQLDARFWQTGKR